MHPAGEQQQQGSEEQPLATKLDKLHSWASSWLAPPTAASTLANIGGKN
jgi:hypothetical protein